MKIAGCLIGLLLLITGTVSAAEAGGDVDWGEILSPAEDAAGWPPPREKVEWMAKYQPALELAQKENRPLFITFRCLPCEQCAEFDKDVLEGGEKLDPLLRQFVTVRITNAEHIDLRLFDVAGFQDLDLSWWGYFVSPRGQVYAIFGGKDHVSDATRISAEALMNTMRRVLDHHYDERRAAWDIDGPLPDLSRPPRATFTLPDFESYAKRHIPESQGCLHCHQVGEALRQPAIDAGTFDKIRDTQVWPLPENTGITLDRDHGLLVKEVAADSPAAAAGVEPGDVLAAAGGRRLFGQADFRGVLHRGPKGAGEIELWWLRGGKPMPGLLKVEDGWRKTVLDWRISISQGNIGAGPGFFPLSGGEEARKKLGIEPGAMAVRPFIAKTHPQGAREAGLSNSDLIVAVNGESPDLHGRAFLVWFRLQHEPGDRVTLRVIDSGGKQKTLSYLLQ